MKVFYLDCVITIILIYTVESSYKFPFNNPSLPWEERVDDLVKRLTLDEIVQQSVALYQKSAPSISRLGIHEYYWVTECLRGYQYRNATAFPVPLGLSSSFSEQLIYEVAEVISTEVRSFYNDERKRGIFNKSGLGCFSPVVNIAHHPLWGRIQETYGEDPFLIGELAAAYVKGIQGNHSRFTRANACCKHFDVHSGPENIPQSRMSFNANVSQLDLQMTFLPQFKSCIDSGSKTVMCSYNSINGIPACANKKFLTDILRKQLKFKGYVISDSHAIESIYTDHKYNTSSEDAAIEAFRAGCNIELKEGIPYYYELVSACLAGRVTLSQLRDNLKPIMKQRFLHGEFDLIDNNPYAKISEILSEKHQNLSKVSSMKSFVLLKNKNFFLPIYQKVFNKVAIIGPMCRNITALFGDYAPRPDSKLISTPGSALVNLAKDHSIEDGCNDVKCLKYNKEAVELSIRNSDVIVLCLGTGIQIEMEGNDRFELALPGRQLQLLKDCVYYAQNNNAKVILLLFNAGPLDITYALQSEAVTSILWCGFAGMKIGTALLETLRGLTPNSRPAGRLTLTWPSQLHNVPPITNYSMHERTYRYSTFEPLLPFGFGLSYARLPFIYSNASITPMIISNTTDFLTLSVTITSQAIEEMDEVIQVYNKWTNSSVIVPNIQLCEFQRITLKAKTTIKVTFILKLSKFAVWSENGFIIEKGIIILYVGGQQPGQKVNNDSNVLRLSFTIV